PCVAFTRSLAYPSHPLTPSPWLLETSGENQGERWSGRRDALCEISDWQGDRPGLERELAARADALDRDAILAHGEGQAHALGFELDGEMAERAHAHAHAANRSTGQRGLERPVHGFDVPHQLSPAGHAPEHVGEHTFALRPVETPGAARVQCQPHYAFEQRRQLRL